MKKLYCYVKQPNSLVTEIEFGIHDEGQVVLEKVCEQLGIVETDYFGLMHEGAHGERLWLNTRNSIDRQMNCKAPYRFELCIKLYVEPHLILQSKTRHQFYLNIQRDLINGVYVLNDNELSCAIAHMAQADHGDLAKDLPLKSIYKSYCPPNTDLTDQLHTSIVKCHKDLTGLTTESAEYMVLDLMSKLDNYGKFYHLVVDCHGATLQVDVGPKGIQIHGVGDSTIDESIDYPSIHMITHTGRCVYMTLIDDAGDTSRRDYMLPSKKAASGLYRCITEMHSFYRCETVRNAVTSQYSRDLKGTLASIFSENTSMGKNYLFDIRRTSREAYDHASRILHADAAMAAQMIRRDSTASDNDTENQYPEDMRTMLEKYENATLCRVCMDAKLGVAFFPCGHVVCCVDCADHVEYCPLCRSEISEPRQVYMPM